MPKTNSNSNGVGHPKSNTLPSETTRVSTKVSRQSTKSSNSSVPTSPEPSDKNQSSVNLKYITSRLIVLTTSREDQSNTSRAAEFLDQKHCKSYTIYSLDQSSTNEPIYRRELFHDRVIDLPLLDEKQSPCLIFLLWFCQKITVYLLQSSSNVAILHCTDDSRQSAFGACALLAYHKVSSRVDQLMKYYQTQRCLQTSLTASQKRYIQYLCDLSFGVIERPHFDALLIRTITVSPIPLVNRNKNGCRPFVDIYNEEYKKVFTSFQEIAKLRVYSASDKTCVFPINISFTGDLTIHISHATIGSSRKTHENGIRICELKINSNFVTSNRTELTYPSSELDVYEKSPTSFSVKIDMNNSSEPVLTKQDSFSKQLVETLNQPLCLFQDQSEFKKKLEQLDDEQTGRSSNGSCPMIKKSLASTKSSSFENPRRLLAQVSNKLTSQLSETPSSPLSDKEIESSLTDSLPLLNFEPEHPSFGSSGSFDQFDLYRSNSSYGSQSNLMGDDDPHIPNNLSPVILLPTDKVQEQKKSWTLPQMKSTGNINGSTTSTHFPSPSPSGQPPKQPPIKKWINGKKGNVRALLCSLSSVTWPECTWTGCQMHEVITFEQAKKAYRRSLLAVHPDKLPGDPNLPLAQLIFGELKEAWEQLEKESNK